MLSSRAVPLSMDHQHYPSKTPGRVKGRAENAVYPATVNAKGKEASKTPFRPATLQKDLAGKPTIVTTRTARPLGDKTPFPNRVGNQQFQTPFPQSSKIQVQSSLESESLLRFEKTPESLLRPSSLRKHVRVPRSASKSFETPSNKGHHWDISEASIIISESQVQETITEPENDYDEIEYMPPNTLDLPYQSFDFELPNYKEVGKTLFELAHEYPYDDSPAADISMDEGTVETVSWNMLSVPELESDDPFHEPFAIQKESQAKKTLPALSSESSLNASSATATNARMQGIGVAPRPVSNPKPVAAQRASSVTSFAANPKTTSRTSRPATSASSTMAPASRPTLKAGARKSTGPGTIRPTAPAVERESLRGSAAIIRQPGPIKKSSIAATTTMSSRSNISTATAARNRAARTPSFANAQLARRPTTSAMSHKPGPSASSFGFAAAKAGGFGASKHLNRKGPVVGGDVGVDVLVIRSSQELDDDFKFDV